MRAVKPPITTPLQVDGQIAPAWAGFFQGVADRLTRLVPSGVIYNNDAAAAAGGVPLGGLYYNGTIVIAGNVVVTAVTRLT